MALWRTIDQSALTIGYFPKQRNIFGSTSHIKLGVIELALNPVEDVSATIYALRQQPTPAANNTFLYGVSNYANATFGTTLDATFRAGSTIYSGNAEIARQRHLAAGANMVAAIYYRVGLSASKSGCTARADYENRRSNGGRYGFQTFLSDQYAYNGNSLVFFPAPIDGLRDSRLTIWRERGAWSMLHEHHWFRIAVGGKNYGEELNVNVTYKIYKHWHAPAQWARYRPNLSTAANVDKTWITVSYLLP